MGFLWFRHKIESRTDLINHLIASKGYRRYLEIGVRDPRNNFDKVRVEVKHSVDPDPVGPVTFKLPSDEFFAQRPASADPAPYDLVFVDGLHIADQVERDIVNSLAALAPGGMVVVHDCNPKSRKAQLDVYTPPDRWNGSVWKAWAKLRATRADLFMCVIDMDEGCGVVRPGSQQLLSLPSLDYAAMDYDYLASHRREVLNMVSRDQFLALAG
jgi:hypothetical protein